VRTYYLAKLFNGSNLVLATVQRTCEQDAIEYFRSLGYLLDENGYLKEGDTTYCVAVNAFE
jgi:hypothetical protein